MAVQKSRATTHPCWAKWCNCAVVRRCGDVVVVGLLVVVLGEEEEEGASPIFVGLRGVGVVEAAVVDMMCVCRRGR